MLGNMEAMLSHVRGACSAKCPASVQLHFTAQMIQIMQRKKMTFLAQDSKANMAPPLAKAIGLHMLAYV